MEAIRVQQTVRKKGELTLRNLPVEVGQQVEVVLFLNSRSGSNRPRLTARQLLHSDLIGLWKERSDITDSASYARELRQQAQQRPDVAGKMANDSSGH